jgi:coenzyme F420 hydrogenase subunit beta
MTSMPSPVLDRVVGNNLCSGCGGCAAVAPDAIKMGLSREGFLRPKQHAPIIDETDKRIAAICPGVSLLQEPGIRADDPLWGPFINIYTGHSRNAALRHAASSGGALSSLLEHLLESKTIDRVLQVAADPKLPIGNRTVLSSDTADVIAAAGSRYAPSAPLEALPDCLASTHTYAFVGKPCDVAALAAMRRYDARIYARIPYLISFFCAGVPSLAGPREILRKMGIAEQDLAAFRYRGNGWPGFATATHRDRSERRMSYFDSWGGVLSRHVQFRCKICPDGTGGFADVVCADAWETDERGYPLFEERDGVSLIITRTPRGEALVRDAVSAKRLRVSPFDASALERMQPGQTGKRRQTLARLVALRLFLRPVPRYEGFYLLQNAFKAGLILNMKNFLGTIKRIILGKI